MTHIIEGLPHERPRSGGGRQAPFAELEAAEAGAGN
jgi:hypothetical protein